MKYDIPETKEELQEWLDTEEGMNYVRDVYFESMYEVPWSGYGEPPYWLEEAQYGDVVQHIPHMIDRLSYGDTVRGSELGGPADSTKEYVYVDSVHGADEVELQADDGGLAYAYLGSNYFRIWRPKEEVDI